MARASKFLHPLSARVDIRIVQTSVDLPDSKTYAYRWDIRPHYGQVIVKGVLVDVLEEENPTDKVDLKKSLSKGIYVAVSEAEAHLGATLRCRLVFSPILQDKMTITGTAVMSTLEPKE